ncbi:glucocorticoid receptor-like (DNA-binding domain) [Lichtheimia hyalospora FSU 10163]|nr:glucocorticoid receptor-like (DNA-binding domain) [Lichtheimia hyalospora FSU 10163]
MDTLSASNSLSFSSHSMDNPSSPSPASNQQQQQQQQSKRKSSISEDKSHAKHRKEMHEVSATQCANCGTTTTPLWRRAPNGDTICNACGLYFKARNQFRPPTLKRNSHQRPKEMDSSKGSSSNFNMNMLHDCGSGPESGTCPGGGQCNGSGGSESCAGCPAYNQHQVNRQALICANCRTTTTPLWRRDESGNTICNACGLYYKLHGMHRPVSMKRSVIKRRKRVVVAETSSVSPSPPEEKLDETAVTKDKHHHHHRQVVVRKQPKNKSPTKNNPSSPALQQHQQHDEVPPIEDYIIPKRQSPDPSTPTSLIRTSSSSSPVSPPPPLVAPRPRLPQPSNGIESLLLAAEVDVDTTTTTTSSSNSTLLPPISLPPLTSSLSEFDDALDRLVRLRRQPSSQHTLQQIAPQLRDLVRRAEASCFHPHQQTNSL